LAAVALAKPGVTWIPVKVKKILVFPHPTLSEMMHESALDAFG